MPYVFCFAVLVMAVMLLFASVSTYRHGAVIPLIFAATVLVLLVWINFGLALRTAIHIAMFSGAIQLMNAAWVTAGAFSPRLAWLLLLPITPFFIIGRRAGYAWTGVVLALQSLMAWVSWRGLLDDGFALGPEHALSSFTTYAVVGMLLMVVPLIYDHMHERAVAEGQAHQRELEQKQRELEVTLLMRDQFIASVSHELRTPMNAILGFNDLLLARIQDKPVALQVLNHTRQSADHLMTVINDVLDYSQLQSGGLVLQSDTFVLRETVNNAFEVLAPKAKSLYLDYRCEFDPALPDWVQTDRHRLVQVLVNLLGNALKFTPNGAVVLSVRWLNPGIEFSVQDSGIGIPLAQQAQIFDRFAQGQEGTQKRFGGNGLGLAISQRLVQLLGGAIGFESAPGRGSRFWFRLPLVAAAAPPQAIKAPPLALQTTERAWRFLVVDDHPVNRLLVHKVLKNTWAACEVVEAGDGAQALAALRTEAFDLVLMDMVMAVMDGIEATHALRQTLPEPARSRPVLGLTANVNQEDLRRFEAAGLDAVMLKPFHSPMLCREVERLLLRAAVA